jgi:hypothetical protein
MCKPEPKVFQSQPFLWRDEPLTTYQHTSSTLVKYLNAVDTHARICMCSQAPRVTMPHIIRPRAHSAKQAGQGVSSVSELLLFPCCFCYCPSMDEQQARLVAEARLHSIRNDLQPVPGDVLSGAWLDYKTTI